MTNSPTIFALSTAPEKAAVAVVRLSGARAGDVTRAIAGVLPEPRRATLRDLRDPRTGAPIDAGLVLWLPGPASFTGEDMAEFHLHGGRAVIAALIDALAGETGVRAAEAGEFTKRAFLNGKLDLTEAEAIADLVDSETAAQRKQALRQLEGAFGRLVENWRERLVAALAYLEASIDFADEDLGSDPAARVRNEILGISNELAQYLGSAPDGERLREGLSIAIVGPPNAGKSTLLNFLARREAAIVSAVAGTTRDVIEVHLDLHGYPAVVADTAGLRRGEDEIEEEGVRRARARAAAADVKLVVVDAASLPSLDPQTNELIGPDSILVINKIDVIGGPSEWRGPAQPESVVRVSLIRGDGMEALTDALRRAVERRLERTSEMPAITRARHRAALTECVEALRRYGVATAPELAAEDVRLAVRALGRITGHVDVEDLLDVIFRDFCIGK